MEEDEVIRVGGWAIVYLRPGLTNCFILYLKTSELGRRTAQLHLDPIQHNFSSFVLSSLTANTPINLTPSLLHKAPTTHEPETFCFCFL